MRVNTTISDRLKTQPWLVLLLCGLLSAVTTGCLPTAGGHSPSSTAFSCGDRFPKGPEDMDTLARQAQKLEQYRLDRQAYLNQQSNANLPAMANLAARHEIRDSK